MARQARSTRRQQREQASAAKQGLSERARERRRRVKPVAETKAQTGQKRERRSSFVRESYGELRKVEWPNQRQLVSASAAVLIAVAVVGLFLWVADEAFSHLVRDVLLKF